VKWPLRCSRRSRSVRPRSCAPRWWSPARKVDVRRVDGTARFASIADWVRVDVRGWTLADLIDDQQFAELLAAARTDLRRFAAADGRVEFPAPALVGVGTA
jgi:hypothetical protein